MPLVRRSIARIQKEKLPCIISKIEKRTVKMPSVFSKVRTGRRNYIFVFPACTFKRRIVHQAANAVVQ